MKIILSELVSPLGAMALASDQQHRVRALNFVERRSRLLRNLREHYGPCELTNGPAPDVTSNALQQYFAGELDALNAIDIATAGSPLQERVWAQLRRIPAGQTTTYGAVAQSLAIHDWRGAVDVGTAVGANPIAIVVPCHRVLGASNELKGYAWGLHRKRWLLEHEGAIAARLVVPETASLF
jgi:methylated-DNA-[protein]-cysteine S-methyltransferase